MFLIVAFAALVLAIFGIVQRRWSVNNSLPPMALSPDGKSLAVGLSFRPLFERRHPVLIHDLTGTSVKDRTCEQHEWCVEGVAYSPDGKKLYSVGDSTLRTWDPATGEPLGRIDTGSEVSACLAVSPSGRFVATGNDSEIRIQDTESQEVQLLPTKRLNTLCFSPDGAFLVSGTWGGNIDIRSTQDWSLINSFKAPAHAAFLPDGRLVTPHYTPASKQEPFKIGVAIHKIPSGEPEVILPLESYAAVSSVATSIDGRYIAAAHGGHEKQHKRAITIWDANSLEELQTWSVSRLHTKWVDEMVFSKDGETLYCASNNNTVSAQHWKRNEATSLYKSGKVFPWPLTLVGGAIWVSAWFLTRTRKKSSPVHAIRQGGTFDRKNGQPDSTISSIS